MARPDLNTTVGADTRPLEKDIRAALNKNYKVSLESKGFSQPLGKIKGQLGEFEKSLDASNARVLAFGASAGAIVAVQQALKATVTSAINVEKKLKDINVLLGASSKSLASFGSELFKIAGQTGQSFDAVADAAAEFARQGLGLEKTLLRTRDALVLTRLSGLDVVSSVSSLTAAINSFSRAALNSTEIVNKLANVDAAFAVSSADLANALSRVGSAAQDAGVSFDELLAIVTSAQQTTARGGAVIGNSFKTIFTRIQRPKVLDELERLGVTVRNLEGETRPAIQILGELAKTFDGLSSTQKSQVGELVGGVFQINILKAALSDLNKEYSIYDNALQTSIDSTDQALKRNEALNETLSALINKTFANLQKSGAKVGESVFGPSIRTVLNTLNTALEGGDAESIGEKFGQSFFKGIGKFISGPGLIIVGSTLTKVFINLGRFAVDALKTVQNLNIQSAEQRKLQAGITNILDDQPAILEKIRSGELKIEDAAQLVLERYRTQQAILRQNLDIVKQIQARSTGSVARQTSTGKKAGGYVPNFAGGSIVDLERRDARMGGYTAGNVIASPVGGVMNTAETIAYDSRFSSPFINPPENSLAGRRHKNKSINSLGIDPYGLPQIGFAAGGLTPEGYTYPFRMMSRGKARPVAPKDVVKNSREYELQLLKGGLASLGFTDAKDLNSIFGPNVQADFLAKKGGIPYLIDAKAGYNDAKLSQIEKKGATIAALRKTQPYKNYIQSLGINDADVRTAIIFGNAGIQQEKTLRKKGILRSAKVDTPNYNRGQLFERIFAKRTGSKLQANAPIDFKQVNLRGAKSGYRSYDSNISKNVDAFYGKYGHAPKLMADKIFRDNPKYLKKIANGELDLGDLPYLEILGQPKETFKGVKDKRRTVKLSDLPSKKNQNQIAKLRIDKNKKVSLGWQQDSIATQVKKRKAKGSIPNFAAGNAPSSGGSSGGNGGGGSGSFNNLLFLNIAAQPAIEFLKTFGQEGSKVNKSVGAVGDSLNTFTSAVTLGSVVKELEVVKKGLTKVPGPLKKLTLPLIAVGALGNSFFQAFKGSARELESLAKRSEESAENLQRFNGASSNYLSAFSNYTQAIESGTADARTIQRLNQNVQEALLKLPPEYRAQVASAPDFESLKEAVAKTSKELQDRAQSLDVLKNLAKQADGFFGKKDIVESIGADKLAKQIGQGFNFQSLVLDTGDGFQISEQLTRALAGESLDEIIQALNLTGEEAEGLKDALGGSQDSIEDFAQALSKFFEETKRSKEELKLITELQKQQRNILAPLKKEIALLTEEAKKSVPNLKALYDSFATPENIRDQEEGFREAFAFLKSGTGTAEQRVSVFQDLQKFAQAMGREIDVEAALKTFNLQGAFEGVAKRRSDFIGEFENVIKGQAIDPKSLTESIIAQATGGIRAKDAEGKLLESVKEQLGLSQTEEELLKLQEKTTVAFQGSVEVFRKAVDKGYGTSFAASKAEEKFKSATAPRSAKGFIPSFASARAEKQAALSGGYNAGRVFGMNIPGAGRVVANTAETVKQFPGMSQPAIMPPSFSKAGKNYAKAFSSAHGFDPYAAGGFVPNFSTVKGIQYAGKYLSPKDLQTLFAKFDPSFKNLFIQGKPKVRQKLLDYAKQTGAFRNVGRSGIPSSNFTRGGLQGLPRGFTPPQSQPGFFDELKSFAGKAKDKIKGSKFGSFLNQKIKMNPLDVFSNYGSRIQKYVTAKENYKFLVQSYNKAKQAGASGDELIKIINKINSAKGILEKAVNNNALKEGVSKIFASLGNIKGLKGVGRFAGKGLGPAFLLYSLYSAGKQIKEGDISGGIKTSAKGFLYAIPGIGLATGGLGELVDSISYRRSGLKDFEAEAEASANLRAQTKERIKSAKTTLQKQLAIANESGILPKGYGNLSQLKKAVLEENLRQNPIIPPPPVPSVVEGIAPLIGSTSRQGQRDIFSSPSVQDWIIRATEYQKTLGKNTINLDPTETTQLARAVISNNERYITESLKANNGQLPQQDILALGEAYKQSLRKKSIQERNAALGFIPNLSGGESLARRTERRLTGSAIRSFDPRIGTYYRSAGQPASLDSLIRRDHPEGLSQAIKNSYSVQNGGAPNFAENSMVADAVNGLVSKLDQLISTLGQEGEAAQATQQIQAGDVNVPLDIGGITINTNMESLMAEFTNQLGQVREEFNRKISAIPGSQNVRARIPN